MNQNTDNIEVTREAVNLADAVREVEQEFQFSSTPLTNAQAAACNHIEAFGRGMAQDIATMVPPGKEQTIAVNAVLTAVLWARQGITKRTIEMVAVASDAANPS